MNNEKFYYDVHVFFSRHDGYSVPVKTDKSMDDESLLNYMDENDFFTENGDGNYVDYIRAIDKEQYIAMGGK